MDALTGSVERVTYYNPENGYSVLRLKPDQRRLPGLNREGLVTVTGNLPELSPGEHLRLEGRWVHHARHGLQFQVETCEQVLPATVEGIRRYLGSGLVKGIGPHLAANITATFGANTLEIIENHPERLQDVPDIGPKRMRLIAAAWQEQKDVKEIMLFLHGHGISTNLAVKIYKQYGNQALAVVQNDPYRLARDIHGIGFKTADRIAQALGLPPNHPSRIEAGIVYSLNELSDEGHVFAPQPILVERAAELLGLDQALVSAALERLRQQDLIRLDILPQAEVQPAPGGDFQVRESDPGYGIQAVYLTPLYQCETGVAERLNTLNYALPSRLSDLPPAFLSLDPQLSPEQREAVNSALSHPLSILTGGPGTGKTTTIKALIDALEAGRKRYALASPTGRAAKRLSEATGRPASTIHRLLGYKPGEGFKYNASHPLQLDMLVIDEASMIDLVLINTLLKALEPGTHLLLVGDIDQLPSVGAGNVLGDMIRSGLAPVNRLSVIFRQAAGSMIIANAHRINQGKMPLFAKDASADDPAASVPEDFYLFPAESAEEAARWVEEVVNKRIPARFGLRPKDQIQVLAPMYRGPAGVTALNERLQQTLNPPDARKAEKALFGQTFRNGDKVMQLQNNYDKEVFNGDIGFLKSIDLVEHTLLIDFDGREVSYDWSEADQLTLAYAISVHKSQGSEFPAVVIPLITAHYLMLQRNLLYTAVTRAKQLCVLVGSRKAIAIAVHNDRVTRRYTALDWRLQRA
mgnify:CR=1 FL=1